MSKRIVVYVTLVDTKKKMELCKRERVYVRLSANHSGSTNIDLDSTVELGPLWSDSETTAVTLFLSYDDPIPWGTLPTVVPKLTKGEELTLGLDYNRLSGEQRETDDGKQFAKSIIELVDATVELKQHKSRWWWWR